MRLTVATWNVEYAAGAYRNARRCQLLQAAGADVVVLTETYDEPDLLGYTAHTTLPREGARPGARWTTIWTRRGVRRLIETADPTRTVAVELEDDVIVYGTVLPWHTDTGPSGRKQLNWAEFRRVLPIQGAEWRALRQQHPGHTLVVAGDFNQSLADRYYYGSRELRSLLERECAEADLVVHTGHFTSRFRFCTRRSTTSLWHHRRDGRRTSRACSAGKGRGRGPAVSAITQRSASCWTFSRRRLMKLCRPPERTASMLTPALPMSRA